jgi:glycosyltransferase involved in cell wall biosynthesis
MVQFDTDLEMEPTARVSVIIPTYNRAHYIGESIRSVLSQTYTDLEIIVVDDGSTDDTAAVIANFNDKRLRYIQQENLGRSKARNHGLSVARGHYITFLDSDDVYLPEKIELQVTYLKRHPGTAMVYTSAYCMNDAGVALPHRYEASVSGMIYEHIAFFMPVTITLPTVMTYRDVLDRVGGFDEQMHRFEDTDMWRRISKSYRIDAMPEYTCNLRTHSDNALVSQNPAQIISALEYYAKKILREDTEISLITRRRGLAALYRYYGYALIAVPAFYLDGKRLLRTAYRYDSVERILRNAIRTALRIVYYRTLNELYRIYSCLKRFFKYPQSQSSVSDD